MMTKNIVSGQKASSLLTLTSEARCTPSFTHCLDLFDNRSIDMKRTLADRMSLGDLPNEVTFKDSMYNIFFEIEKKGFTDMLVPPTAFHYLSWITPDKYINKSWLSMLTDLGVRAFCVSCMKNASTDNSPAFFLFHRTSYRCELEWDGKIYPELVDKSKPGLLISNTPSFFS